MKFWMWLARICSVLFIAFLVIAWVAEGRHAKPDAAMQNDDTPPAPLFR